MGRPISGGGRNQGIDLDDGQGSEGLNVTLKVEKAGYDLYAAKLALIRKARVDMPDLSRVLHFQMPPLDSFTIDAAADWEDYSTLRLGERSRPNGPRLRTYSFQTLFLEDEQTVSRFVQATNASGVQPELATRQLMLVMEALLPLRLTVAERGLRPEVDDVVTLRSVRAEHRAGEPGTRYVDVQFTRYEALDQLFGGRQPPAAVTDGKSSSANPAELDSKGRCKVKPGESLRDVSVRLYGTSTQWKTLKKINGIGNEVQPSLATDLVQWLTRRGRTTLLTQKPSS
jgi:hypothetical protein